jgi:hypothetical protein
MPALASALIRLYPRSWRERYGDEMSDLLHAQRPSLRTYADLVAGAIDARFNPQLSAPVTAEGAKTMTRVWSCQPAGVSTRDARRSAAWMIGGSLGLTLSSIVLQLRIGNNALSEGLLYAAFPASLMLSSECTYFKRYSPRARLVMSVGGALLIVLMMWVSFLLKDRL